MKQINELKVIRNRNFRWVSFLGNPHIWDIKNDSSIISVDDKRIYFKGELSIYSTSEIIEDIDEAMIIATCIINTHY